MQINVIRWEPNGKVAVASHQEGKKESGKGYGEKKNKDRLKNCLRERKLMLVILFIV